MADDMGWSDIGCYGSEIKTPNLDSLASKGVRFTQFYNTGRCCPTRATLLSGVYAHQAGIGWMMSNQNLPGFKGDLGKNVRTIAEVMKSAGYATYMAGKWHVTPHVKPEGPKYNWPRQRGFDQPPFSPCIPPKFVFHGLSAKSKFLAVQPPFSPMYSAQIRSSRTFRQKQIPSSH